jgi:hypothetical protein
LVTIAAPVSSAEDVYKALKQETASAGGVSSVFFFVHSDPNGLYMRDQQGLYLSAAPSHLKEMAESGELNGIGSNYFILMAVIPLM